MKCPRCKLINPAIAERCDCGYDFRSGTMADPFANEAGGKQSKSRRDRMAYTASVILFAAGLAIVAMIPITCAADPGGGMGPSNAVIAVTKVHFVASTILAVGSIISGCYVVRRRKVVLLWLIPSCAWILLVLWWCLCLAQMLWASASAS